MDGTGIVAMWSAVLVSNAVVIRVYVRHALLVTMEICANMIAATIAFQCKMVTKGVTFIQLHAHLWLVPVVSMAPIV